MTETLTNLRRRADNARSSIAELDAATAQRLADVERDYREALEARKAARIAAMLEAADDGWSNGRIAKAMGVSTALVGRMLRQARS